MRFEEANGWKNEVRAVKLPTLLEGEALAIFTEIREDERKNYHKDRRFEKGISSHVSAVFFIYTEKRHLLLAGRVSSHVFAV